MDFDLIIGGGGINGAALARLAAYQGLKVGLFESGDFGQGASSNTSKMLHGGLRYLETFDFALVRDAVRERAQLLEIAPHLVEAKRFLFPNNKLGRHSRPGIKAGLMLYDLMALDLRIDSHRWVDAKEVKKLEPNFLPDENCGAYEYSDCVMDDARMVMENLVDARSLGAEIFNYQSLVGLESGSNVEVTVLDRLTGKEIVHTAKQVAITLGPWTDEFMRGQFPTAKPQVKLSQGIHLIVEDLDSQACFILPVPKSKRYFFVLPWKGKHLVGTTETEVGDFPPRPTVPQVEEIEELKNLLAIYFPHQKPKVICTLTGIRPLARSKKAGTVTLSREHEFHKLDDGIFSAVGGKYTTHRSFAQEFLKFILAKGGKGSGGSSRNSATNIKDIKARPLPGAWQGADGEEKLRQALLNLDVYPFMTDDLCKAWIRRYGVRAIEVAEFVSRNAGCGEGKKSTEKISSVNPLLKGEVSFAIEKEWAKTPVDFYRRRTDIYFTSDGGFESMDKVEEIFAEKIPKMKITLGEDADYGVFLKRNRHCALINGAEET